jgi:hypothetical protein
MDMLSADTESIGICRDSHERLLQAKKGEVCLVEIARKGESAPPLPVVLMVGHVGWQLRIKLPVVDTVSSRGRRQLKILPGKLQRNVEALFAEMGLLTGVGIQEDLSEFFQVIKSLFGVDTLASHVSYIELDILARAAGYNLNRHALCALNWIVFGTILPKGEASVGDQKWYLDWEDLPKPLKMYSDGDISQAAGIAFVLTASWILQMFPDAHAVTQVSALTPAKLMSW